MAEEATALQREGYLVLRGLLPPQQVGAFAEATGRYLAGRGPRVLDMRRVWCTFLYMLRAEYG